MKLYPLSLPEGDLNFYWLLVSSIFWRGNQTLTEVQLFQTYYFRLQLTIASRIDANHVLPQQEWLRSQGLASVLGETNEQRLANLFQCSVADAVLLE